MPAWATEVLLVQEQFLLFLLKLQSRVWMIVQWKLLMWKLVEGHGIVHCTFIVKV
jgi:hypothetical protein